jgi:ribosomal protein S18 acetylase RimI-like enzyme
LGEKAVFIYAFTVKSGDQRKGFGRYLFADLASTLKKADYEKISLRVLKTNIAAYQFWQSMGFTEAPGKILDSKDEFAEYYMEVVL